MATNPGKPLGSSKPKSGPTPKQESKVPSGPRTLETPQAGPSGPLGRSPVSDYSRNTQQPYQPPTDTGDNNRGGGTEVVTPPPAFSSLEILENMLRAALGVEGLGQWAMDLANRGATNTEIVHALRYGTDTSDAGKAARAKYLAAFPKMDQFLKDGIFVGENPEAQYMEYRKTVREAASRYGASSGLVSNDRIADYISGRNSAAEIVDRMNVAATAISTTPAETYRILDEYYGVKSGDMMDFYLDTDRTEAELQKRYTAARIGTEAARQRFGIDSGFAENLAQRGVSVDEANKGFGSAFNQSGFMAGKGETIDRQSLAEAQFGDANDAAAVQRIAAARRGAFESGGGFVTDKSGVSGLASASQ